VAVFLTQCTWYSVHDLCKDFRDKRTLDFRENENNYIDFVKNNNNNKLRFNNNNIQHYNIG